MKERRKRAPDDVTLRQYTPVQKDNNPGPNSAGQSGDDMGLPKEETAGSESEAELAEEGQFFEAEVVEGVERPYPDEAPVRTREGKDDDVPFEYPPKDSGLDTD